MVNHKRIYRLMHEDNLLCLRKRRFVATTPPSYGLMMHPDQPQALPLPGLDLRRVSDLTYIRLVLEFVYMSFILGAFFRQVIGWALDHTLEVDLALRALQNALQRHRFTPRSLAEVGWG